MMARRKRSAKLYVLPGVERRDLAGSTVDSLKVLQCAIDAGVTDVVVVGRNRQGELYVAGSSPDMDKVTGSLMRAVHMLAGATFTSE